jgi:nucleoside-diphosphate-sugar epimerase
LQTKDVLKPGDVLNLGSGIPTSFYELAKLAAGYLDAPTAVECDPTKPEGVFYRVADVYKMSQFYQPKVSLEEGIRRVAEFIRLTSKAP